MVDKNISTYQYCTDVQYMTKAEMRKYLDTQLIDYQWNLTTNYRDKNAISLRLRDLNNKPLKITETPAIIEKIDRCNQLISLLQEKVESLSSDPDFFFEAQKRIFAPMLETIASFEGKRLSDSFYTAVMTDVYSPSEEERAVYGYLTLLRELLSSAPLPAGEEQLAHFLETLEGTDELLAFYRESDRKNRYAVSASYAVYDRCPAAMIEQRMNALFSSLEEEKLHPLLKGLLYVYYLYYLKPFDEHNLPIAAIAGKALLCESGFGKAAAFLPLEELLRPSDRLEDINSSVQANHDFTYFVCYAIERLHLSLETVLDQLSTIIAERLAEESRRLTRSDLIPSSEEEGAQPEEAPIENAPEILEAEKETRQEIQEEKPSENIPSSPAKKERKKKEVARVEELGESVDLASLAISSPRPALSDKEVREVARYILETHPNVRRPQALFYASHCTLGRYYTIQDYKKSTRCVYETARTSMDNLAKEGFYEKRQFKNKFVYTPIKQGEKS